MRKICCTIILLLISNFSYGFNYRQCQKALASNGYFFGPTSAVQWTSSTGSCSAMASRSEEKKRFFAINYDKFQNEVAQGTGDHLYTFGQFSNCSEAEQLKLNSSLKQNYRSIFSVDYDEKSYMILNDYVSKICSTI